MAVQPSQRLAEYNHQAWVMENGLPQNTVQAILQTRDGFVWVGTQAGLARFDGVAFQVFDRNSTPALPGADVQCLYESRDGALWIGTNAGLARWKDGAVNAFTTQDGLPGNSILALREDTRGGISVWTDQGPVHLAGDRLVPQRNVDAFPPTALPSPGEYPGAAIFEAQMPGGIQVNGTRTALDLVQSKNQPRPSFHLAVGKDLPGNRIQVVFADREGALWIGTNGGLVRRTKEELARWTKGAVDRFPVTEPLRTASILAIFEDREGNLWVGTESDGLHILRDQRFLTFGAREGLSSDAATAVVEDSAGKLWVGTQADGVNVLRRPNMDVQRKYTVADGLASDVILSLAAAPNGDIWLGTPDGLNRIRGGKIATFTSADGLPDDLIRSLLIDNDRSLWIGTRHGLAHWIDAGAAAAAARKPLQLEIYTQANGLGSDLVGAMTRDAHGDLWIATWAGVSRLHGRSISNFSTGNGLPSNVVTALLARDDGSLLIGTQDHGWDFWDGRRFLPATRNGLDQSGIHAILDDGRGRLWFATGNGISRCDCNRMTGGSAEPGCSHWLQFGAADGLRSRETANAHPSAWRSRDGKLWFATPKGIVEVDPAQFPVNTLPPPVTLERFAVDDLDQPLSGGKVPSGHVHFEFAYAGLSFIAPQKVRYRYKLEGFDRAWIEAGARRVAYYTNIPPGRYTFRVQAANNDGVWNTAGAALSFDLRPHLYQTVWFYALLLAAMAGMVMLLLKQRVRHAEREFKAVLGERSRIAREVHDTLIQGFVGASAQLEVIAQFLRLHKIQDAVRHLDLTREQIREGLAEARQSIWALRTQDSRETTLPVKLRRIVEAADSSGLESRFSMFGAYRPLSAETERELLRIAQEAVHNVKKHAAAKNLSVQLEYGPASIALEVRDDGRGGVTDQPPQSLHGHFGLAGMRERAAAIGGTLDVSGEPGGGTSVRLCAAAPPVVAVQSEAEQGRDSR